MTEPRRLVCAASGRYVDADDGLLDALAFTYEELRALPVGALSDAEPEASAEIWRGYTEGRIALPTDRSVRLVRKDGSLLEATLARIEPGVLPDTWDVWLALGASPAGQPALHFILSEWRAAERELAAMPADDPIRPSAEGRVRRLRALYQQESARRGGVASAQG